MPKRLLSIIFLFALLVGSAPALAQAQGERQDFFIDPAFDFAGRSSVTAALRHTSVHAYFYVEDSYYLGLSSQAQKEFEALIRDVAEEFDSIIYPKIRNIFGAEWVPGIDNDSRITILLTRMQTAVGGYTRILDEKSKSAEPASNEREMIYLNTERFLPDKAGAFLAHEFQHLINYNKKDILRGVQEETWLNEALSEYAPTAAGYNSEWDGSILKQRVEDFQSLPFDSLLEWKGSDEDSASAALFAHYLAGRYGEEILGKITASSLVGVEAVSEALSALGKTERFGQAFTDWVIANYVNGSTKEEALRYSYQNPLLNYLHFHVAPLFTASVYPSAPAAFNLAVKDWEGRWYRFVPCELGTQGKNVAKFEFETQAAPSEFVIPLVVTDIFGQRSVQFMDIKDGKGVAYVDSFGVSNLSVAISPINQMLRNGKDSFFFTPLTLRASLVEAAENQPKTSITGGFSRPDGTLIRAQGDFKVYVVHSGYKRWIQSPAIMNMYGHLRWADIVEVTEDERDFYPESFLVREASGYRVHEVTSVGRKQWLNMSAREFEASGRSWDAVFIINKNELKWFLE